MLLLAAVLWIALVLLLLRWNYDAHAMTRKERRTPFIVRTRIRTKVNHAR